MIAEEILELIIEDAAGLTDKVIGLNIALFFVLVFKTDESAFKDIVISSFLGFIAVLMLPISLSLLGLWLIAEQLQNSGDKMNLIPTVVEEINFYLGFKLD